MWSVREADMDPVYPSMLLFFDGVHPWVRLSLSSILGKYIKGIIIPLITLENASRGR
jgi:hypothetical protein